MSVRVLLQRKPTGAVTIGLSATIAEAARLLIEQGVGGLPVLDGAGKVAGFLSERDFVRMVDGGLDDLAERPVSVVMRRPAPSCSADDSVQAVMQRMTRERLRHLVVMDGGRLAGVISVGDIVRHRLDQLETETGVLRDYVAAQRAKG